MPTADAVLYLSISCKLYQGELTGCILERKKHWDATRSQDHLPLVAFCVPDCAPR
jgi:hypothetical protein